MIKQFINNYSLSVFLSIVIITMPLKSNINSISIILLLIYCLLFLLKRHKEIIFRPTKELIILILPFLFILIQGFYSQWDSFAKNVLRSLPMLVFPILFYYLKLWLVGQQIKFTLKALVYAAVGYSLILLGFAFCRQIAYKPDFSTVNWYFFTYYDFTEVLDIHPTYLGMYICMAFAIVFYQLLKGEGKTVVNVILVCFFVLIVFLSGSRISLVCLMLITLSLFLFKLKTIPKKTKIILLIFITVLPTLILNFVPIVKERMIDMTFGLKNTYQYAKYGDEGKDNNYNGGLTPRFEIWDCAVKVGNNNYLFGSGYGTTQKLLNVCYIGKDLYNFSEQDYQTHNQYFNNYARGGILGLLILLLLYIYSLFFALKRKQMLHLSLIILIIVASLTENILKRHMGIVFFAFFNSLFFFGNLDEENKEFKNLINL